VGGRRHTPEQIVGKLLDAEKALASGRTTGEVCQKLSITEQTYYRWRRVYGGSRVQQAERLQAVERENARLRKLVAQQALQIAVLRKRKARDS
jgi:hypothetical protein